MTFQVSWCTKVAPFEVCFVTFSTLGYLAVSLFLNESHELLLLLVNTVLKVGVLFSPLAWCFSLWLVKLCFTKKKKQFVKNLVVITQVILFKAKNVPNGAGLFGFSHNLVMSVEVSGNVVASMMSSLLKWLVGDINSPSWWSYWKMIKVII